MIILVFRLIVILFSGAGCDVYLAEAEKGQTGCFGAESKVVKSRTIGDLSLVNDQSEIGE